MEHRKASILGREERMRALARSFSELHLVEKWGRDQGLPIEDILDAAVACWSALRLVGGKGRSLPALRPARHYRVADGDLGLRASLARVHIRP